MRSSVWALCLVALFCVASARSKNYRSHGDNFLDQENYQEKHGSKAGEYADGRGAELVVHFADEVDVCDDGDDAAEERTCKNGAKCTANDDGKKVCGCLPGTDGPLCGNVLDCAPDKKKCGVEAKCEYDTEAKSAVCICEVGTFDDTKKICKGVCNDDDADKVKKCKNGGECTGDDDQKICECLPGTNGALCNNVIDCTPDKDKCGVEAECKYDIKKKSAFCDCETGAFDVRDKKCKETCEGDSEEKKCHNGGTCTVSGDNKFCSCKKNTTGSFCETVSECEGEKKKNCGTVATCGYDILLEKAICKCPEDTKLIFDEDAVQCRDTCDDKDKKCQNGASCQKRELGNFCKCLDGTVGHHCETVPECNEMTCGDEAKCAYDVTKKSAVCKCNNGTLDFDPEVGKCKVDYCKEKCGSDPGVLCEGSRFEKDTVKCTCKKPSEETFDEKNRKCRVDHCKKKCGISEDVICKGDKFVEAAVVCTCEGNNMEFVNGDCKFNHCKHNCGVKAGVKCDGDHYSDSVVCNCTEANEKSFDVGSKECKTDYCKKKCTTKPNIKCEDGGNKFDEKSVKCTCKEQGKVFDLSSQECKDDKCLEQCKVNFDSDGDVKCINGPFGDVKCTCKVKDNKFDESDHKCKLDQCTEKCGVPFGETEKDVLCEGKSPFDAAKIECKCRAPDKSFDKKATQCREQCDKDDECDHGSKCKDKFCDCLKGTTGDYCNTVIDCLDTGIYNRCRSDKGECSYNETKQEAECKCSGGKELYDKVKHCEVKCKRSDKDSCKTPKVCNEDLFCACKEGYHGDDCDEVVGCDKTLKDKCEKANAECDWVDKKATCKCNVKGFVFDGEKCLSKFCFEKPCRDSAICVYDEALNASYCKCSTSQYYNYATKKCTVPDDKCLLMKEKCGKNQECKNGECVCAGNYEKDGEECKSKFCEKSICFLDAECEANAESCSCKKGKYYDGYACRDAACILGDFKKNCDKCPPGFVRKEKNCVPTSKDAEECTKNCGYGYCVKEKGKENAEEVCKCIKTVAELKDDICVLKTSICASKLLTKNMKKCNCTNPYKDAEDGLTCTLITCADKVAQDDCAKKGAICKMQWKDQDKTKAGYSCECPSGYTMDKEKDICTDPCGTNAAKAECRKKQPNSLCFNSYSDRNKQTSTCACPPTLDGNGCSEIAKYDYLVRNIPVLKTRYDMKGKVDYVKLNSDIMDSMKQMFKESTYRYAYLNDYVDAGDVLKCNVWIHFNEDPEGELKRFALQAQKFNNETFKGLEIDEDLTVLPPRLLVSAKDLDNVQHEKLEFCSAFSKDSLCGKEAGCSKNKCFCPDGYKTIDSTFVSYDKLTIQRCEDINECALGSDNCPGNTVCENTIGSYFCKCKPGFKKENERDKSDCTDLCTPSPCKKGSCSMVDTTFDCKCDPGYGGALCERADVNYSSAKKGTVVVGAVLGTILALAVIAFLIYYWKVRKGFYSEDFTPAARQDHPAEMMERRPMRGVVNKSYE